MEIINGNINNGIDDIAKYLGLEPKCTLFMHSTSFNEYTKEGIKRKSINKGRMLYAEILSYGSCKRDGAKLAITHFNNELLNYFYKTDLLISENVIQIGEKNKVDYPYNSVSLMLLNRLKEDKKLKERLEGYTIVSSYLSTEDFKIAKLINGNTIMKSVDEQIQFNSKYIFRNLSEKYNFKMPLGFCVKGISNLNNILDNIRGIIKKEKYKDKVWIKLESQSSGTGNILIEHIIEDSNEDITKQVLNVSKQIYDDDFILNEMQFIVEIDVEDLLNEIIVENMGIEAVISEDKIIILGGVGQETKQGKYLGSYINDNVYKHLEKAQEAVKPVLIAYQEKGYRGFITIDILITKNQQTGDFTVYNIEPNARFSAGIMLLKNVQKAEKENHRKMYGISYSRGICIKGDVIRNIKQCAGQFLYKGKKTNYKGIIPALINDVTILNNKYYYLKTIVIEDSYEKAKEVYEYFVNNIRRL